MSVRVVGYAYQADIYCTACMSARARAELTRLGRTAPDTHASEQLLTIWARALGLTYPTGASDAPDTNTFPFPILSTTEDADGRCGQIGCAQPLLD